jgi:hypothetical protein
MKYTWDEYGGVALALVLVTVGLLERKGNTRYVLLVTSSSLDCIWTTEAVP